MLTALAAAAALGPVAAASAPSEKRAVRKRSVPISGLEYAEQLPPGRYDSIALVKAGFGGKCCRPPAGTSKAHLLQQHRMRMAEKKTIRRRKANG